MRFLFALCFALLSCPVWAANVTLVMPDNFTPLGNSSATPLFTSGTTGGTQAAPSFVSESAANFATSQATAGTAGTLLCAARPTRRAATLINLGTTAVWLGNSTAVTTTTGSLLAGVVGSSTTIPTSAAIYGVVGTGTQAVSCLETF